MLILSLEIYCFCRNLFISARFLWWVKTAFDFWQELRISIFPDSTWLWDGFADVTLFFVCVYIIDNIYTNKIGHETRINAEFLTGRIRGFLFCVYIIRLLGYQPKYYATLQSEPNQKNMILEKYEQIHYHPS